MQAERISPPLTAPRNVGPAVVVAVPSAQMPERVIGARGAYILDAASRREGGQAEVFRAVGPDGRSAAIRMPRQEDTGWFARECSAIDDLTTRLADAKSWMIAIVDRGVAPDGRPFAVMPWYPMNLTEWFRTGPPLERRLDALGQACRAVARLHQGGAGELDLLVHRDLKPSNLLVREDEAGLSVVLTDLGAARAGALLATVPNTLIYTRSYAPPEQQLPIQLAPDPTVDVHALGVTVYFGLTGRVPTTVLGREALRTTDAQRLLTLDALGSTRSEAEEAEYRVLAHKPLAALLDLAEARALFPGDEAVLRSKLADQLTGRCHDPEGVAARIAAKMIPALHRALEPDPARRLGDARILQAACHHAVRILRQEGVLPDSPGATIPPEPPDVGVPATPVLVTTEPSEVPALTDASLVAAPARRSRPAWLPVALGAAVGMASMVALAFALRAIAGDPEDPPAAPAGASTLPAVPAEQPAGAVEAELPSGEPTDAEPEEPTQAEATTKRVAYAEPPVQKRRGPKPAEPAVQPPPEGARRADTRPVSASASPAASVWVTTADVAPPRLVVTCRPEWTVQLDGSSVSRNSAQLGAGTHRLDVRELNSLKHRSSLTVRQDGDGWIVVGDWVTASGARVASGAAVDVVCPN